MLKIEGDMSKRDWNRNLQMWGKRGWNNFYGGWSLKISVPSIDQMNYSIPIVEKRSWMSVQVLFDFTGTLHSGLTQ